jgi:hypothetical protein
MPDPKTIDGEPITYESLRAERDALRAEIEHLRRTVALASADESAPTGGSVKTKKITGLNWRHFDDVDEDFVADSPPKPDPTWMSEAEREIATHWPHHDERITFKGHPLSYCERVEGFYRFATEHHFITCDTCALEASFYYGDEPRCRNFRSGHREHRHKWVKPPR